jgi:hypothetical protein
MFKRRAGAKLALETAEGGAMKFINMYFVGYVVLILGLTLGLWQAGILQALAPVWIAVGLIVAIGMGIMLAVSAGKPPTTTIQS